MKKLILATAVALLCAGQTAQATNITSKEKCLGAVQTVVEMKDSDDTPQIGDQAQADVDSLANIATHLCEAGNFADADKLLQIARGMLASE